MQIGYPADSSPSLFYLLKFQNAAEFIEAPDAILASQGGKTEGRSMMVLPQDIVESLVEKSTDTSPGMEETRRQCC